MSQFPSKCPICGEASCWLNWEAIDPKTFAFMPEDALCEQHDKAFEDFMRLSPLNQRFDGKIGDDLVNEWIQNQIKKKKIKSSINMWKK